MVSMYLQTTAFLEEELLQVYVRVRAITCPIFRCFVCLCEIVSTNRQSSCILHVHAFDKIVMLFIRICILNSYVNLNQNQSCQFQISSANNKCLLSCQFQNSTVLSTPLSNSSSCSYVNQIQFLFKYNLSLLAAKWLVRIQEQLVPVNLFLLLVKQPVRLQEQLVPFFDVRRVTSSHPRTARAFYFVSRQPSNQFISENSLCFLCFLSAK